MIFKSPGQEQIPLLRCLWKQAFGDTEEYLDAFFGTAFLPERSLCAFDGEVLTGMLFWFDVSCEERKMAYLYAVATAPEYRGRGVCRQLMTRTQELLRRFSGRRERHRSPPEGSPRGEAPAAERGDREGDHRSEPGL